jgi:hypothetical protein
VAVRWNSAVRIIRSLFPPIDLFEDIADPADWALIAVAEQKTNPRLMETIGNIDLVPVERRVSGIGASYLMAPFTHISVDRPSRFSVGHFGVLYVAQDFETALFETIHHHAEFMAATNEPAGWTSQFREIVLDVKAEVVDLSHEPQCLKPDDYIESQRRGADLEAQGVDGVLYPSVRSEGQCVGLFYPDCANTPVQGRHLDYHWDGQRVDLFRDATSEDVFRILET